MQKPVLYSFRRCPYAMRARMALRSAAVILEHREILLKNKPPAMLAASPKGTVPVLVLPDGAVLEQSWDIMLWALSINDPENMLGKNNEFLNIALPLIDECDAAFKTALDCYKYADRHPLPADHYRQQAEQFLASLDSLLVKNPWLLGDQLTIADIAIMPFIRQFAYVDRPWFDQSPYGNLREWLDRLLDSTLFQTIMEKKSLWEFDTTDPAVTNSLGNRA